MLVVFEMSDKGADIELADLLPGLQDAVSQAAALGLPDPADYHVRSGAWNWAVCPLPGAALGAFRTHAVAAAPAAWGHSVAADAGHSQPGGCAGAA